ncbi:hypothetical protein ACFY05_32435 [Microtetraspora fusca]|uniref:Aminotransferase class III-fold pyridoxal phosphate-dependent enzyme n=1 Tax=Microtetraspora fusca TaxID=1997 RepID=A0ABW6VF85_MICFU
MTYTLHETPTLMMGDVAYTTKDGIQIWDLGGDLNWLVTIGHHDPAVFAAACEEATPHLREWGGRTPSSFYRDGLAGVIRNIEQTMGSVELHRDPSEGADWQLITSPNGGFRITQWVFNMTDPQAL